MSNRAQKAALILAVLLPLAILAFPLGALMIPLLEQHEPLAAWAQAFGSVLAIAIAMWVAVLDGKRSRIAQERQATLQKEALEHQVRHAAEIQKQQRDAALNAVCAAMFLYYRAVSEILSSDNYEAEMDAYGRDLLVAKGIMSKVDYAHLANAGDMANVSHIMAMLSDADAAIDKLIELDKAKPSTFETTYLRSQVENKPLSLLD